MARGLRAPDIYWGPGTRLNGPLFISLAACCSVSLVQPPPFLIIVLQNATFKKPISWRLRVSALVFCSVLYPAGGVSLFPWLSPCRCLLSSFTPKFALGGTFGSNGQGQAALKSFLKICHFADNVFLECSVQGQMAHFDFLVYTQKNPCPGRKETRTFVRSCPGGGRVWLLACLLSLDKVLQMRAASYRPVL